MSIPRTLSGPLLGTAVAGVILYSVSTSLSTRTHQVTSALHGTSYNLRRLAQVDDTRDLVRSLQVAPDNLTLTGELDAAKDILSSSEPTLRSAYYPPSKPSLTEQIKSRWNQHLLSFSHSLAEADIESTVTSASLLARRLYARATGSPLPETSDVKTLASSLTALAPSSPESAATLRDPVPARIDPRLNKTNTHYLGQGTSLR